MDTTDDDVDGDNVARSHSLVRRIFDGIFFSGLFDFNCEIRSTEYTNTIMYKYIACDAVKTKVILLLSSYFHTFRLAVCSFCC